MTDRRYHQYGFNVFHQQPEERIEYAATHNLHHIEINLSRDELSIDTFDSNRIDKLHALCESHNIKFSFHIPYYINISDVLIHLRKSALQYLLKSLQVAGALQATHLTMHLGSFYWFPVEQWERKKALKRFIKSLEKVLPLCEQHQVKLALENVVPIPTGSEYYLLGDNITDFEVVFSSIDSPCLKFCLDTGHANMAEGVMEYINHFEDRLICIHYHDNNGSNDEHLPVGKGTVSWQNLAAELKKIGYCGPVISECRGVEAHQAAALFEKYFNNSEIILQHSQ